MCLFYLPGVDILSGPEMILYQNCYYPGHFRSNRTLIFQSFWLFVIKCMWKSHLGNGTDVFIKCKKDSLAFQQCIWLCWYLFREYKFPKLMTPHLCVYFILVKGCNIFPKENTSHISFPHAANVERGWVFFFKLRAQEDVCFLICLFV